MYAQGNGEERGLARICDISRPKGDAWWSLPDGLARRVHPPRLRACGKVMADALRLATPSDQPVRGRLAASVLRGCQSAHFVCDFEQAGRRMLQAGDLVEA